MPLKERPKLRKSQEQRVDDWFKTKERLTQRRGLRFHPDRARPSLILTPTRRNFGHYVKATGLDFEKLFKGKRVLDVGCGDGLFVREARKHGILAEGINPEAPEGLEHITKAHIDEFGLSHQFDPSHQYHGVVAMYSVPFYSSNAYNVRLSIYHMLRLVKPGGMLIIHPFSPFPPKRGRGGKPLLAITKSMLKKLNLLDFEIELKPATYDMGEDFYPATLVIKKREDAQVISLGERLGVITIAELEGKIKKREKETGQEEETGRLPRYSTF